MNEIRQSVSIAGYNFRLWWGNPRILVTFLLTFIMCFLISDKAVTFAVDHNTTMQLVEVFIWNFGDSNSILLSSVLLVLLFADMPFFADLFSLLVAIAVAGIMGGISLIGLLAGGIGCAAHLGIVMSPSSSHRNCIQ